MKLQEFNKLYSFAPGENGRRAVRITCGKCRATADISQSKSDSYTRLFSARGWAVGSIAAKHRCPDCVMRTVPLRLVKPHQEAPMETPATIVTAVPVPNASEQPPRQMTREDRRLINAKLEEVYIDEAHGYAAGWHDERVAREMGMPRAWVEKLRDENFGPQFVGTNPEIQTLADQIERASKQLGEHVADIYKVQLQVEAIGRQIATAFDNAKPLQAQLDKLRQELRRLTGRG